MNLLDNAVTTKTTIDCGEGLVFIPTDNPKLIHDTSVDLGYKNEFIARETVVGKLVQVAQSLPTGVNLSVKESHRPLEFQEFIFERRARRLTALPQNRAKSPAEILKLTAQFIAPPSVAGHPTGGAVDVSLVDTNGKELDLGCEYDEDESASDGKCFSFCTDLSETAASNRKILFSAMTSAGFVNYPYEWWHWSYGDKYWAAVNRESNAIYGAVSRN